MKGHQIIGELRLYLWWAPVNPLILKGHQIIGELRLNLILSAKLSSNWKVTRSLVSYDSRTSSNNYKGELKGHQIIGELRLHSPLGPKGFNSLKGHQIIGELRLKEGLLNRLNPMNWKVTRSLVSYDSSLSTRPKGLQIERSPDHWWVTTPCLHSPLGPKIERSPDHWWVTTESYELLKLGYHWKVTRSLVSYDLLKFAVEEQIKLKGHQIIGELRHKGSFRPLHSYYWKVTRSLVSYDL